MENVGLLLRVSIVLVIWLSYCEPRSTDNGLCISECFDTVQNSSSGLKCQPANLSNCQGNSSKDGYISYMEEPATLSDLSVTNSTQGEYLFNFTWKVPWAESSNKYYNVLIEYGKVVFERAVGGSCSSVAISTQRSQQHLFSHSCYDAVKAGTNYSVSLTSLPDDISLTYFFNTPENLTCVNDPPTLGEWESVVGFAIAMVNQTPTAYVVFQPLPSRFNITSYHITIKDVQNRFTFDGRIEVNSSSPPVFRQVLLKNIDADQYFYAQVQPACNHTENCPFITSSKILMPKPSIETSSPVSTHTVPSTVTEGVQSTLYTHPEASTTTDPSVIVKPSDNSKEHKNVTIVVAVVCGVAVAGIVIGVVYCIVKKKQCCTSGSFAMQRFRDQESNSSIAMDGAFRSQPTILIIYSYDCEAHERVVVEFATYLKHVFGCEVSLDIWEQADIQARGAYIWMKEKLQWSQYVIVICSTGARFKCVRRKPFRVKEEQPVPDIFQDAVDLVAESLRCARENGVMTSKFIVSYFEYSRDSDIPPKLDTVDFYFLMNDILRLYCHIFGIAAKDIPPDHGLSMESYMNTEIGEQLFTAIERANLFFKNNPDWLGNALEPLPSFLPGSVSAAPPRPIPDVNQIESELVSDSQDSSPIRSVSPQQEVQFKGNGLSRVSSTSVSLASEEDALIEERRKKRHDFKSTLDRWKNKHSRQRNDSLDSLSNIDQSPQHTSCNNGEVRRISPVYPNDNVHTENHMNSEPNGIIPHKTGQSALKSNPFSAQKGMQEDTESLIYDDRQLQQDIDYIQNYDLHHQAVNQHTMPSDVLLTIPASYNDITSNSPNGSIEFSNKLYEINSESDMSMESQVPCTQIDNSCMEGGDVSDVSDVKNNNIQDSKISVNQLPQNDPWKPLVEGSQTTVM